MLRLRERNKDMIDCTCTICGKPYQKKEGAYNRALKLGMNIFCSRACCGVSKRTSIEDKKAKKAAYDKRVYNTPERKEARRRYFQKSYTSNPEKYRELRRAKYPKHLEYLNTPEYKAWKKEYDKKYIANKNYGVFSEAAIILIELESFLKQNMPDELKFQMGITNKTQKRKRLWQRTNKNLQQQI